MMIRVKYTNKTNRGFTPKTRLTFLPQYCLFIFVSAISASLQLSCHKKVSKKSQDCARFTRKTYARKAKILQTPLRQMADRQTGSIFTLLASLTVGSHLFFGSPDEVKR